MRPGAKGSVANFCSTITKVMKSGNEAQREAMVMVADQDTLLPRSRPRSRVNTAQIRTKAPRKSTRRSLVFQPELSLLGSLRARATLTNARAHMGTCARKAL